MAATHQWQFSLRFRRNAFGWQSDTAILRIKEALAEIKAVAKKEPAVAAEGAVLFLTSWRPPSNRSTAARAGSAMRSITPSPRSCRSSRKPMCLVPCARPGWIVYGPHTKRTRCHRSSIWDIFGATCARQKNWPDSGPIASRLVQKRCGRTALQAASFTISKGLKPVSARCIRRASTTNCSR